jgi:5-dehydro-2-deoxygluconokinase
MPGTTPLSFEGGPDVGVTLREWPVEHVVKCLVFYHPDHGADLHEEQERQLSTLFEACRETSHELLLEVIPPKDLPADDGTVARALQRFYELGIFPDWWKLPSASPDGWANVQQVIERHDPHCRGIVLLGLDAPLEELEASFAVAAKQPLCKGFAVGRTIFGAAAAEWFAGRLDDDGAVDRMAANYRHLIDLWHALRGS